MPKCLGCNGKGEQWVDWAETYAPCMSCDGSGQVSDKVACLQQSAEEKNHRRHVKKSPPRWNRYNGYRIQSVKLHWTDFDTIGVVEWNDIRIVETAAYGLYLVNKMNEEVAGQCDYGDPYRLVSPKGQIVNQCGVEVATAYSEHHYPVPGEY